ncbi:T9SS type A sorting domain-containing protein [Flavobacterium sp. ASV13]|uniref:T9SS type A sorting domain-containing protein n=1 Tax=Flavobacterium sp. ASV13 TaxID=1506583 RepID=UPI000557E74A|nr:T9SS type A sorting domain-containing protein [Flavobacterium sp. ASV13]
MKTKLLLLLFLANFSIYAQTNLVPNGNFEIWTSSSQPDNWYRYFSGFVSQSSTAQNGTSSTNMMVASGTFNYMNSEYFPVVAGKTYRVTLYHKLAKGTFSSIDFSLYHKPGTFKEEIIKKSDVTFSTTEWRKIEFDYTPTVSENVEVDIWTTGSLNSEILVDNISMVDINEVPVQYTKIPDANFEKKLIALGLDSGTVDGQVPTNNINKITSLNIYNSSITNLSGIEDFKALITLDASGNRLASTPDISKNTALKTLDLDNSNLISIDVSANVNLTTLEVSNNKIAVLDITKNKALTRLAFDSNLVKSIDISQNVALTYFSASTNQINALDVSNNINLTYFSVGSNKLSTLDLSKNSKLTTLYCYSNSLTSLNLKNGKNTSLSTRIFYKNPLLTCILVDDVNYSNKYWTDKDAYSYFSSIDCSTVTQIPDGKFEDKLIELKIDTDGKNGVILTSSAKAVTALDVSNSSITDLTGIQAFTSLTNLNASSNLLATVDLSKNSALNTLNTINNPSLTCIQVADVAQATSNWNTTKDAIASFNLDCRIFTLIPDPAFEDKLIELQIDTDGKNGKVLTSRIDKVVDIDLSVPALTDLTGIQDFKALKNLRFMSTKVTKIDVSKNTSLTYLDCRSNQLTSLDVSKNINLTALETYSNPLKKIDVSKNTALTLLNCGANKLTYLDISNNTELINLDFSMNNLKTIDLSKNTKLKYLNASINEFTTLDLSNNLELVGASCYINQLKTLDLSKNKKLSEVLLQGNKLVNLNLKNGSNLGLTINILANPNLACVEVDDVNYANTNWATNKDLTTTFSSTACPVVVVYTNIPDPKFEDKLIELKIDNDGKNGKVATESINKITTLDVSGSGITDLTGIADFTLLNTLLCNKNQLTSLDISGNPLLTNLNCSENQIEQLEISSNTLLKKLDCSTNQLKELNVSENAALTFLNTSFNKILNLDASKNTSLTEINCSNNNLYNLNVKNGNNVNMQNMSAGNFTKNPNLLCIQVDDATFSKDKWIAKDDFVTYSSDACAPNYQYTAIPDQNFERSLISLGLDSGTVDGKVLTSNISKIKSLTTSGTPDKITDLTGIQDFVALETFTCTNQGVTTIDLSKNTKLKAIQISKNSLTTLDISKNTALQNIDCSFNNLTELNVSNNTLLTKLYINNNQIKTIDVSKIKLLEDLEAGSNQLTNIDVTSNLALKQLSTYGNKIPTINVTKNTALTSLSAFSNEALTSIDVTQNLALTYLNVKKCQLTAIDVSKNTLLYGLDVSENKIETINVSLNPKLTTLLVNSNQLTSLNLKNGKNTLLNNNYVSFLQNPKLYCILVDNIAYANQNWSSRKSAYATYNTECTGELTLPANNFNITTKGESCLGENNGEISIIGTAVFAYTATIGDKTYTFTNNSLKVTALAPGIYNIKITIPEIIFEQNFNVTIQKGATISGKSSISAKKVDVEITEGTAPFTVFIDGQAQFETNDSNFSLDFEKGGLLEVATSKACEGVYSKKIATLDLYGTLEAYPNPTSGSFEIEIPTKDKEVTIELYNFAGQLVSAKNYTIENGKVQLNLENQPSGIYAAKIYFETPEYIKIIKK